MQAKTAIGEKSILRMSALCYIGTSLGIVALFLTLTQIVGGYAKAAVIGGAIWSFILSMIVTMPLYTAFFKRRFAEKNTLFTGGAS